MAYKNLVNQVCTDKKELFCRLRDYLCARNGTYDYSTTGIGWTLHDSNYAVDEANPQLNDWFVLYSAGESGDEDLYIYFKWTSGYLQVGGYRYWNNTTHSGVSSYGLGSYMWLLESGPYKLHIYGDLDFFHMFETDSATFGAAWYGAGKLTDLMYDDTVATSASSLSSGTDVSITVNAIPASWAVGKKIYIRDNAGIKIITIKTLIGNTITADLTNSFTAGCKLQMDLGYYSNSAYSTWAGQICINRTTGAIDNAGSQYPSISAQADPDELNSTYIMAAVNITSGLGYYGRLPHTYYCSEGTLITGDTVTESVTGDTYRYFKYYNNLYTMIKEV